RNRGFMRDLGTSGLIAYVYDTSAIDGTGQSWLQIPQGRPSTWGMATCPITNCLAPEQRATARENPWLKWDPDNPENILIEANLDPLIRLGDRVTVEGVTIELIESGQFDRVRISTN
ncbi:MAG: hypothetical protein ACJZ6C_03205, partial [Candidatus Poriferisodalaceae bacterium]